MNTYKSQLLGATIFPDDKAIAFYGGIFSQWAMSKFSVVIEGTSVEVNCAEQAMMLKKAAVFNDTESYIKILKSTSPKEQKAYGRLVKNFDANAWSAMSYDWIVQVSVDKFTQNPQWLELMILTDPYELVEASPYDRIWGTGVSEEDTDFSKRNTWGTNWLGEALMDARKKIIDSLDSNKYQTSKNYKL